MCNVFGKLLFPALIGGAFLISACDGGDTPSNPVDDGFNAFTDPRDGNVYRVVEVGDRTWMAENLRYRDVEADPILKDNTWCAFDDEKRCEKEGFLYSWAAVMLDSSCAESNCEIVYPHRGICPEGWHVAENYEWQELAQSAAGQDFMLVDYPGFDWSPTGVYYAQDGVLMDDGGSRYWTSSTRTSLGAFEWFLEDGIADFFHIESGKDNGYAVRCVADSRPKLDTVVEYEPPSSSSRKRGVSSSSTSGSSSNSLWESYVEDDKYNAFTDKRDGNVYRVVQIGSQVWMAEDLRYFSEDMEYPSQTVCTQTGDKKCEGKRRLYSFYAAMDDKRCKVNEYCWGIEFPHRGICPEGWHLPEIGEWWTLSDKVKLKGGALNSVFEVDLAKGRRAEDYGFSAFATGEWNGEITRYDDIARYWTATETGNGDPQSAIEFYISGIQSMSQSYRKDYGYAVRCVADEGAVKLDTLVEDLSSSSQSSSSEASSSSEEASSSSEEESSSSEEVSSSSEVVEESSSSGMVFIFQEGLETFTDKRDGEVYTLATVGKQVWMAENLRYADSSETPELKGSVFCWQDDPENCKTRGALYLWSAVVGKSAEECGYDVDCNAVDASRGICPEGFHVPSHREWQALQSFIGSTGVSKLFAKPLGADLYGFGAIPSGEVDIRDENREYGSVEAAHFWTSTQKNNRSSYTWYITGTKFDAQGYDKRMGYAVRCIKDAENTLE